MHLYYHYQQGVTIINKAIDLVIINYLRIKTKQATLNSTGKSRNLTTQIVNKVQQYEAGVEISPALSTRQTAAQRCTVHQLKLRSSKLHPQQLLNWKMAILKAQCGNYVLTTS